MKKRYIFLILLVVFTVIFVVRMSDTPRVEETGMVVPVVETSEQTSQPVAPAATKDDLIVVESPRPGEKVSSPLTITGRARGNWFFEASFPITITDWDGLIIGEGYATAQGEWMTTDYVPFTAQLTFNLPADTPYRRGTLILQKNNASGEPHLDNAIELPVTF